MVTDSTEKNIRSSTHSVLILIVMEDGHWQVKVSSIYGQELRKS